MEKKNEMTVFIVDDDPLFLKGIELFLLKEIPNLTIKTFSTGEACLHEMHLDPDVVIVDYYLNSEFPSAWNGVQILKKINLRYPDTQVIVVSAKENIDIATDSMNEGALEYIVKDKDAFLKIKDSVLELKTETKAKKRTNIYTLIGIILVIVFILFLLIETNINT